MDWLTDMSTNLWVLPRGARRTGIGSDPNPLTWENEYGSVVATVSDSATPDGMNERGLGAHLLWLARSDYGARDHAQPALSASLWPQFFLDRFATVAECVSYMAREPFQVRPQLDPRSGRRSAVDLALDDATGDSAIIEYIGGSPVVHHGRPYTVMTNSPAFENQLDHLQLYQGFGGSLPLPGTTAAADRFVRASYYVSRLPSPETACHAYAALLSVLRNAAQPFGTPDPARPNVSMTIWRTLADLTNGVYAFESSFSPDVIWTHLGKLSFDHARRLDLSAGGLCGDVTGNFQPADPFEFASA
jgi:penicillin V acylase-like amidase (Ntn superfamily)